jgi:hypothetical protein
MINFLTIDGDKIIVFGFINYIEFQKQIN